MYHATDVKREHRPVMESVKIIFSGQKIREKSMKSKEEREMPKGKKKEDTGVMTAITTDKKANGWVIQNLRNFHNSVIPKEVLDSVNGRKDLLPTLIEYASGIRVTIVSEGDSIVAWEILGEQ